MKIRHMNKPRRGIALIMALVIVLAGSIIVTITFDIAYSYAWFSQREKVGYVDHTTLLSYVQLMKGRIVSENVAVGEAQHVSALKYDGSGAIPSNLTMDDLRFKAPDFPAWQIRENNVKSGVGTRRVEVDVYDMFFDLGWVNPGELENKDFPPIFKMKGTGGGSGLNTEGAHIAPGSGTNDPSKGGGDLDPANYGAYLVRVRLYDNRNNLVRTAEEAFVLVLPTI